jgi:hypothetical protein
LDEGALEVLQEEAKNQSVSVNTLLNQLILEYVNFDRPMKRFQMIKLPSSTFKYLVQDANDETLIKAGRSAGNDVPRTYIRARWGELTEENALEYLKIVAKYTNRFNYSEVTHSGRRNVTLSHSFGAKGSLFLQNYVQAIFSQLGKFPKFSPDENAVVFELE